jgi:hypothetical protein
LFTVYSEAHFDYRPPSPGYPDGDYVYNPLATDAAGTLTISAIPEPAAWTLMLIGFGLAGAYLRGSARIAARARS